MNVETEFDYCAVCKQQTQRRCARCLCVYYCNQDHQRKDWRRHKGECLPQLTIATSKTEKKSDSIICCESADQKFNTEDEILNNVIKNSEKDISQITGSPTKETRKKNKSKKKRLNKERDNVKDNINIANDSTCEVPANLNVTCGSDICVSDPEPSTSKDCSVISSIVTNKIFSQKNAITDEGSSEQKILSEPAQQLTTMHFNMEDSSSNVCQVANRMNPNLLGYGTEQSSRPKSISETTIRNNNALAPIHVIDPKDPDYEVCRTLINDMNAYGVCLLRNFYGKERGLKVLNEVLDMYKSGIFTAGELVSNPVSTKSQNIRSDLTTWIDGSEPYCYNISRLMSYIDKIIMNANKMADNGRLGDYDIKGRTKAMVACYPGSGTHYVQHIDNPHKDGRCITAIYYLNLNWDVKRSGGLLRVFPEGMDVVCNVEPKFDQMLFFWSDRRNPHEVQPSYDTRYAVTVWYFDYKERTEALKRFKEAAQPSTSK